MRWVASILLTRLHKFCKLHHRTQIRIKAMRLKHSYFLLQKAGGTHIHPHARSYVHCRAHILVRNRTWRVAARATFTLRDRQTKNRGKGEGVTCVPWRTRTHLTAAKATCAHTCGRPRSRRLFTCALYRFVMSCAAECRGRRISMPTQWVKSCVRRA